MRAMGVRSVAWVRRSTARIHFMDHHCPDCVLCSTDAVQPRRRKTSGDACCEVFEGPRAMCGQVSQQNSGRRLQFEVLIAKSDWATDVVGRESCAGVSRCLLMCQCRLRAHRHLISAVPAVMLTGTDEKTCYCNCGRDQLVARAREFISSARQCRKTRVHAHGMQIRGGSGRASSIGHPTQLLLPSFSDWAYPHIKKNCRFDCCTCASALKGQVTTWYPFQLGVLHNTMIGVTISCAECDVYQKSRSMNETRACRMTRGKHF